MTAERELAGFVLPFTIGLGLTAVLQTVYSSTSHFFASASLSCILICMYTLLQSKHNKLSDSALWITVIILGLCSGVLIQEAAILHFSPIRTDRIRILKAASDFGEKMKSTIASIPFESSQTNAIATALITGDRGDIRPDVLEFFRKSGASHILALSGMHLGIIYGLLKIILAGLGNTPAARRIKACFSIFICGFYALSTGAGPSIT